MRTPEQIVDRIENHNDMFGFTTAVLLDYLPWEQAKQYLKDEGHAEWEAKWPETYREPTPENVLPVMQDYMEFALEKAENHRGISASRSVLKMTAWAWLLEDEELLQKIEEAPYENYGVPKLKAICWHLGWPFPDDEWAQNMAASRRCCPDCDEGCGE